MYGDRFASAQSGGADPAAITQLADRLLKATRAKLRLALESAGKTAVNMVVRSAQGQYPDLTVVALHPGWVRTDMGGTGATLAPEQSAQDLRALLAKVGKKHQGQFINHDGSTIPW